MLTKCRTNKAKNIQEGNRTRNPWNSAQVQYQLIYEDDVQIGIPNSHMLVRLHHQHKRETFNMNTQTCGVTLDRYEPSISEHMYIFN